MKRHSLLLIASALIAGLPLLAQTAPPPLINDQVIGGTGGQFEKINLSNGGVNLSIPLYSIKGRGKDFVFYLNYTSKIWYTIPLANNGYPPYRAWQANFPWSFGYPGLSGGTGSYSVIDSCDVDGYGTMGDITATYNYVVTLPDGSSKMFPGLDIQPPNCFWYTPTMSNYSDSYSLDMSGTMFRSTTGEGIKFSNGSTGARDSNGNFLNSGYDSSFYITDTVGRRAMQLSGGDVNYGRPATVTLPDGRTIGLTWAQISTSTGFTSPPDTLNYFNNIWVLTRITLPNQLYWAFEYEPNSYGQLIKVTLPTGGYIGYTYGVQNSYFNNYGDSEDALVVTGRYVSSDGVNQSGWSYTYGGDSFHGYRTATETDPLGNHTIHNYYSFDASTFEETDTEYQDGSTPLRRVHQDYACDNSIPHDVEVSPGFIGVGFMIGNCRVTDVTATLVDANLVKKTHYTYDSSLSDTAPTSAYGYLQFQSYTTTRGNVTDVLDYDWGSGAPGALLRETGTSYVTTNSANGNIDYTQPSIFITSLPSSKWVKDGNGCLVSQTNYTYDSNGLQSTSGVPQHDYGAFPYSNQARGNLTAVQDWVTADTRGCGSGTWTVANYNAYDDLGNLLSVTDRGSPTAHTTYFDYTDSYSDSVNRNSHAYITTTTSPTTNGHTHVAHESYYYATGLPFQNVDWNNNYTTFYYDNMNRPTTTVFPTDGGQTVLSYPDAVTVHQQRQIDGSRWTDAYFQYDGLGRMSRTAIYNDESSHPVWDQQDTCYDALGRKSFVSYAYQESGFGAAKRCSGLGDSFSYDGTSRPTRVTHSDSSYASTSYWGRAVSTTDEGNGTYSVQRISQTDGLGRLKVVCEVSSEGLLGGGGTPGSCQTDIGGTGFVTTYDYDALANLAAVHQSGLSDRTFVYDSLSRLRTANNPESGTTSYTYNDDNLLLTRVRPAPNQTNPAATVTTTYGYDELHRKTGMSYTDGVTPSVGFGYDETSIWGVNPLNSNGKLTSEGAAAGAAGQIFSYDTMGRTKWSYQCTPRTCGWTAYRFDYAYDYLGDMTSSTNGIGTTFGSTYNRAGRMTMFTSSYSDSQHPGTLLSNVQYGAFGSLSDTLGNGLGESRNYHQRGWLQSMSVGSYSFSLGFAPDGNITSSNDAANSNWTYGYDQFSRLRFYSASDGRGCSAAYDRFGNRWQQNNWNGSCNTPQYSFTGANNHIDGYSYDAAGNLLNDGSHSYSYDAENHLIRVDGGSTATYTYDAEGRRVKRTSSTANLEYLYDQAGHAITHLDASTGGWIRGEVYADTRHLATYANSTTYFTHSDWLGTERMRTNVGGSAYSSWTSFPFGEGTATENPAATHMSGQERDNEDGLDHMSARYSHATFGRFMSADPLGGYQNDPQTLNKYVFVRNLPTNLTDTTGLDFNLTCDKESSTCHNGISGKWEKDANDGNNFVATVVTNDKNGGLVDQYGNTYNANITGAGVQFTATGSDKALLGVFINGSSATTIAGTGGLEGFTFTFTYSNLAKNQTAGGSFTYNGAADDAGAALERAGFTHHWLDMFNWKHPSTETYDAVDYRSPASRPDGSGSGHMTVYRPVITVDRWRIPLSGTVPTNGEMHLGEHNPFSFNGIAGHMKEQ